MCSRSRGVGAGVRPSCWWWGGGWIDYRVRGWLEGIVVIGGMFGFGGLSGLAETPERRCAWRMLGSINIHPSAPMY